MPNDLSTIFDDFAAKAAAMVRSRGAELHVWTDDTVQQEALPSFLDDLRCCLVAVMGTSEARWTMYETAPVSWPLNAPYSCDLGFLLSPDGYAIVYRDFDGPCGCLMSYTDAPERFSVLLMTRSGAFLAVPAAPVLESDGMPVRLQQGDATLVKLELPEGHDVPDLPIAGRIEEGETVYAIGTNQQHFIIASGKVVLDRSDMRRVATTIDGVHGFCGAPLITEKGELLGIGARIEYEPGLVDGLPVRAYGISWFDRLHHLLED